VDLINKNGLKKPAKMLVFTNPNRLVTKKLENKTSVITNDDNDIMRHNPNQNRDMIRYYGIS
jgi:hypothetical protein